MTSLWLQTTAPLRAAEALPARVDVAIVGGGIAGIATALHLAERGVEVAVLEAGAVASRASGRNDGQLLLGLGEHYHRIVGQFGPERARLLWGFLQTNHDSMLQTLARHGVACDLRAAGGLRLAETAHEATELDEAARLLQRHDIRHQLVPAAELREWFPAGRDFHGALFLPGEAIVQPAAMVRGFAAAAVTAGAVVAQQAPVRAVEGGAGEFAVRLADGRSLAAGAVVHCTAALARELDPSGFLRRVVFPFRGQVLATEPLPDEVLAGFPPYAMSSNFCYEYFRVHDRRLLLGGMRWSVKGEEVGILDDDSVNPEVAANLRAYAARHFAGGERLPFALTWTGIMAGTPDGLPLLGGLPGQPGVFVLGAFNGYGLSFAFLAGRCLAEMIVDGACSEPAAAMFAPRRFA